jgi:hypothetical protein
MKSMVFGALAIAIAFVQPAAAQEAKQDFTLVNKTGYELNKVFVAPSKSDDWEEDVLGQDTLSNNDSVDIKFHRATKTCKWDLKVVYTVDSSSAVWSEIDLCSVDKITIHYDKDRDVTTANFD